MNQDIQNKIDEGVREYLKKVGSHDTASITSHDFREGIKFALSSPELMKEAMVGFADWINKEQYIENGSGGWYKRNGGMKFYSTEIIFDLYLEHLKQKA